MAYVYTLFFFKIIWFLTQHNESYYRSYIEGPSLAIVLVRESSIANPKTDDENDVNFHTGSIVIANC